MSLWKLFSSSVSFRSASRTYPETLEVVSGKCRHSQPPSSRRPPLFSR
jgi:hypothetical protein